MSRMVCKIGIRRVENPSGAMLTRGVNVLKERDGTFSPELRESMYYCRSTSAMHAANPFHKERHHIAQGKTQTLNTTNQTPNSLPLNYFQSLCIYTDTYLIRIHNKCTEI